MLPCFGGVSYILALHSLAFFCVQSASTFLKTGKDCSGQVSHLLPRWHAEQSDALRAIQTRMRCGLCCNATLGRRSKIALHSTALALSTAGRRSQEEHKHGATRTLTRTLQRLDSGIAAATFARSRIDRISRLDSTLAFAFEFGFARES